MDFGVGAKQNFMGFEKTELGKLDNKNRVIENHGHKAEYLLRF